MDEGPGKSPCCLFQDDETVEQDLTAYDCETCAIRCRYEALDDANRHAWQTYQHVAHRLAVDLHMGGVVLQWALADCSPAEALSAFQRVSVIYDTLNPPPQRTD